MKMTVGDFMWSALIFNVWTLVMLHAGALIGWERIVSFWGNMGNMIQGAL